MGDMDDPDTAAVVAVLRGATDASGLPQGVLARALGTSESRFSTYLSGTTRPSAHFCLRARRLCAALEGARLLGFMSSLETAEAAAKHLDAGSTEWAWRMLLQGRDHLRSMLAHHGDQAAAWELVPTSTGSAGFDGLLAALVRREYADAGRAAPTWTEVAPLDTPWIPDHPFLDPDRVIAQTPLWLKAQNIFVPERDLVTA